MHVTLNFINNEIVHLCRSIPKRPDTDFQYRVGVINNDRLFHNIYDHESHILVFNLFTSTIPPNAILLLPDSLCFIVLIT